MYFTFEHGLVSHGGRGCGGIYLLTLKAPNNIAADILIFTFVFRRKYGLIFHVSRGFT